MNRRKMGAAPFFESPRDRRLRKDFREMEQLRAESTILDFVAGGDPPDRYVVTLSGPGLMVDGSGRIVPTDRHQVEVVLGADYPRSLPQMRWLTPIAHPNIPGGRPCLGTFVMTPYRRLTDVVELLWDMQRMALFGPEAYNGPWPEIRKQQGFPLDPRVLRDRTAPPQACPLPAPEGEEDILIIEGSRRSRMRREAALGLMPAPESYSVCKVAQPVLGPADVVLVVAIMEAASRRYLVIGFEIGDGRVLHTELFYCSQEASLAPFGIFTDILRDIVGRDPAASAVCIEGIDYEGLLDFVGADFPEAVRRDLQDGIVHALSACFGP
jgi:hypothetical protein